MNLRRRLPVFLLSCAAMAAHAQGVGSLPPARQAAAIELVRALNLEQFVQAMIEGLGPPGLKRDIAQRIMMQRIDMKAFEAFAAGVYGETFSEDELRSLTDFFRSEVGRKLQSRQVTLSRNVNEAIARSPEMMANFFVSGCAAGVVSGAAEQAQKFQLSVGKPPPTVDDVVRNLGPLLAKAEVSCTCMYNAGMAVPSTGDPARKFQDPAVRRAAEEAVRTGACPRPI
jgi:hypothetical protein